MGKVRWRWCRGVCLLARVGRTCMGTRDSFFDDRMQAAIPTRRFGADPLFPQRMGEYLECSLCPGDWPRQRNQIASGCTDERHRDRAIPVSRGLLGLIILLMLHGQHITVQCCIVWCRARDVPAIEKGHIACCGAAPEHGRMSRAAIILRDHML